MKHIPVLKEEVIKTLAPQSNEHFIDLTLGHGGHASEILKKTAPNGKLLAVEQDFRAIAEANENLASFGNRFEIVQDNFNEIGLIIRKWPEKNEVSGILIDLGPNTDQLKSEELGLSFRGSAPLDMRLDAKIQTTASDILNKFPEREIVQILFDGEERFAKQIARKIVDVRNKESIETTDQLVEIIRQSTPPSYRFKQKTHFATGTFRALRMAVNKELENLKSVLPQAVSILSPGGRLVVITFHSLEDRIVKNFLRERPDLEVLTPKPIIATEEEIQINPSARSAKVRAAIKI
ncbi:MAG: S-adenosyl-methyltransferase MraW, 16S rRNA (cytosine1402-N4)-methyltransferase [Berkelbacteria bacterium GW2011_GWE1_39_12]|uniref:Ribosomal RNA small subunit methyltransferase H n=1 Tax=Berkelbacteria bacterium GW2011_GWE1_39_12 TaxID=1618337 RepID=A0A0G4B271_9BACT|nr:MAG: S-adenosyl-methyltransferase MraW, 16S rRNA (cytosine1402-N4)-methyltransferase [Berkelbacteria bacterium GW2011_GWE1_39_12]